MMSFRIHHSSSSSMKSSSTSCTNSSTMNDIGRNSSNNNNNNNNKMMMMKWYNNNNSNNYNKQRYIIMIMMFLLCICSSVIIIMMMNIVSSNSSNRATISSTIMLSSSHHDNNNNNTATTMNSNMVHILRNNNNNNSNNANNNKKLDLLIENHHHSDPAAVTPTTTIIIQQQSNSTIYNNNNNNNQTATSTTTTTTATSPFHYNNQSYTTSLSLPDWFYNYSKWHSTIVPTITIHNYHQYQYVIITCYPQYFPNNQQKCYGTADRLKMIPVIVKLAAFSQRILFIHWVKPYPIQEYLLPNTVYMNWTIPNHLYTLLFPSPPPPNTTTTTTTNDTVPKSLWRLGDHETYGMMDNDSRQQHILYIQHCTYAANWYNTHRVNNTRTTIITTTIPNNKNNINSSSMNHNYHHNNVDELTNETSVLKTTNDVVPVNEEVKEEVVVVKVELELSMWEVYAEFWDAMFLPSNGLYKELYKTIQRLQLFKKDLSQRSSGNDDMNNEILQSSPTMGVQQLQSYIIPYIAVHVRANYIDDHTNDTYRSIINPMNCAYQLQQQYINGVNNDNNNMTQLITVDNVPIYIASDTNSVIDRAIRYGHETYPNIRVVSYINTTIVNTNPYHIDQSIPIGSSTSVPETTTSSSTTTTTIQSQGLLRRPQDYYATFIDLYMIALGSCYTYGDGGYGSWGAVIGGATATTTSSTTAATTIRKSYYCPSTIVHTKQICSIP